METPLENSLLKIVCLNIEHSLHIERIIPFLQKYHPDVILLQEVSFKDVSRFEETLGMKGIFLYLYSILRNGIQEPSGQATFSKLPLIKSYSSYYRGDPGNPPPQIPHGDGEKQNRAILVTDVIKAKEQYCLINTHFTWSPKGQPNDHQFQDLEKLFQLLSTIPDFILCGDFNAPRGTPIFDAIASRYKDNIPPHVMTTIDKNWHKAGDLQIVVDGFFTTPKYHVKSIELVNNISDHWGILAEVKKK